MNSPYLSKYFIRGITLEVSSVVLCFWISNQIYYGGGWPVVQLFFAIFYIWGAVLIYRSEINRWIKFFLVFWWVVLLIFLTAYTLAEYGIESLQTKKETFLIPDQYHGKIEIYYDQADGTKPAFEGGRVVYSVDSVGIVRTTFRRRKNDVRNNDTEALFFYVDKAGNRTPIKMEADSTLRPNEVFVQMGGYEYQNGRDISKQDYLVFTQSELDEYYAK